MGIFTSKPKSVEDLFELANEYEAREKEKAEAHIIERDAWLLAHPGKAHDDFEVAKRLELFTSIRQKLEPRRPEHEEFDEWAQRRFAPGHVIDDSDENERFNEVKAWMLEVDPDRKFDTDTNQRWWLNKVKGQNGNPWWWERWSWLKKPRMSWGWREHLDEHRIMHRTLEFASRELHPEDLKGE